MQTEVAAVTDGVKTTYTVMGTSPLTGKTRQWGREMENYESAVIYKRSLETTQAMIRPQEDSWQFRIDRLVTTTTRFIYPSERNYNGPFDR